jgi:hypothetical protein
MALIPAIDTVSSSFGAALPHTLMARSRLQHDVILEDVVHEWRRVGGTEQQQARSGEHRRGAGAAPSVNAMS